MPTPPPILDYRPNPAPDIDGIKPILLHRSSDALLAAIVVLGILSFTGIRVAGGGLQRVAGAALLIFGVLGIARLLFLISRRVDAMPGGIRERFFGTARLIPWEAVAFVRESHASKDGIRL